MLLAGFIQVLTPGPAGLGWLTTHGVPGHIPAPGIVPLCLVSLLPEGRGHHPVAQRIPQAGSAQGTGWETPPGMLWKRQRVRAASPDAAAPRRAPSLNPTMPGDGV